jgi:hypothetical protein
MTAPPEVTATPVGVSEDPVYVACASKRLRLTWDAGAQRNYCSMSQTWDMMTGNETAKLMALTTPEPVTTPAVGGATVVARHVLTLDLVVAFPTATGSTPDTATIEAVTFRVVDGMSDAEVLIGNPTLMAIGVDVSTLVKAKLLAAKWVSAAAVGTSSEDGELDFGDNPPPGIYQHPIATMLRRMRTEDVAVDPPGSVESEAADPGEYNLRDPVLIKERVQSNLDKADAAGFPHPEMDELSKIVVDHVTMFRCTFDNSPPMKGEPVKAIPKPSIHNVKPLHRPVKNMELRSVFLKFITVLVTCGLIMRATAPVWGSPAHIIKRVGADPLMPIEKRMRFVIDYRQINQCIMPVALTLPNLESIVDEVAGARYWGKLE